MSEADLKKRIEALERENRVLRSSASQHGGSGKVILITEGSYQGHPTICFQASGRPFTIGGKQR